MGTALQQHSHSYTLAEIYDKNTSIFILKLFQTHLGHRKPTFPPERTTSPSRYILRNWFSNLFDFGPQQETFLDMVNIQIFT